MPPSDGRSGPTRATPRMLLVVAGALLALRVGLGVWDAVNTGDRPELVTWTTSEEAERAEDTGGRMILYAFTDPANPQSRALSRQVFASPSIATSINKEYLPVRVEIEGFARDAETTALMTRFQVRDLPALVVAQPHGQRFKTISGFTDAKTTMAALRDARFEVLGLPFRGRPIFQMGRADTLLRNFESRSDSGGR